uniref:DUF1749-domain-containing protein n=1 Tax=Craspedostauros australis TaxID=1486917 RepID=A0A7R9WYK8_9STRA
MISPTTVMAQAPPLSPYGTFTGALFQYARNLVAFESLPPAATQLQESDGNLPKHKCILIGGLSDGLIPTPYTKSLESACHNLGWSLVQPVLSSSYLGFGNGDLGRDTDEISQLLAYLSHHRSGETFALVGHSTGCQNSIHFLKHGPQELVDKTRAVALQGSVSDREGPMDEDAKTWKANVITAKTMVQDGRPDEMMPRAAFWAPITAQRFLDLHEIGGRDDYFSSDFTDDQLADRLGHVGKLSNLRLLVAFSGADEYVAKHADTKEFTQRLVRAMNRHCTSEEERVAEALYMPTGNHNLSQTDRDASIFVAKVAAMLQSTMLTDGE